MKGQTIAYIRVSTEEQCPDRQVENLEVEVDRIFTEYASGGTRERPQLKAMMAYIRDGDLLVIHSMDRLARNIVDLRNIVSELTSRGVRVQFVKENLTFTGEDSPMSYFILNVLGAVAEFERAILRERQREGIAIAKKKGKFAGKPKRFKREDALELYRKVKEGVPISRIAREYNVTRQCIYVYYWAEKKRRLEAKEEL